MFLDEVGEIPLELQTKLLRVLQEREFERLGSSRTIRTDARLVAATNRDLAQMVEERQFRADLYYRLNVFPITVPPLRDRREDIPLLVRYFVQQYARRMNKRITTIPAESMQALTRYHWPGNIRELQNFIERAVIISPGPVLQAPVRELKRGGPGGGEVQTLAAAEREAILRALRDAGGRVGGDAGRRRQARHEAHHPAGPHAQAGRRRQSVAPGFGRTAPKYRRRSPEQDLNISNLGMAAAVPYQQCTCPSSRSRCSSRFPVSPRSLSSSPFAMPSYSR